MKRDPSTILRLLSLACFVVLLGCAAWSWHVMGLLPRTWALLGICVAFGLVAALGGLLGARGTLAGLATILCLALGFTFTSQSLLRLAPTGGVRVEGTAIRRPHSRYVINNIPGATMVHRQDEFQVRYTMDQSGFRITPTPRDPLGRVTFHGCSFTFGDGVEDGETFSALLGGRHWPRFKVRNAAVRGWGPASAYLALEDELKQEKPPVMVFYGFLIRHIGRSYLSTLNLSVQAGPFPHFEMEGDRLVLKGYVTNEAAVMPADDLVRKSKVVCMGLLREMHRLCQRRKVPFFVLLLSAPDQLPEEVKEIKGRLDAAGVPCLDLSDVAPGAFYPIDGHPTAAWHRAMAERLAGTPQVRRILRAAAGP